ncbi:magnesium/cobalt transporter CorA [Pullulanibacillus sp. KACC 23026]|uniref:magnesium/cobalt transporter CorA n=1 Tax=Pullulanibacillus sp. KACC 23026 TaxID=3028315 RepID=UPI0023AFD1F8|nr:magnesium/cobalt transporter CorA [Pullulanibacillus sp. KACC 23026]WEG12564.1 magnesium/cobalt transporter CorA [Pullulanibacillus sp. KACC 23026]
MTISTLAITDTGELLKDIELSDLKQPGIKWFWVDFSKPTDEEAQELDRFFHFHPLAIEDCMHFLQRPKLDYYEGYNFYVFHSLDYKTLDISEVDLFVSTNYIVSFHLTPIREIDEVWERVPQMKRKNPALILYHVLDHIVDLYFPAAYQIEDQLNDLDDEMEVRINQDLIDQLFDMRKDLLKLRRSFQSMRELLYRMLYSERLEEIAEHKAYFNDIYDHLLRLTEIIESSRDMTADMRDSYFSLNSNRMNSVMMTLTVISSIFIPLTFIVGVYGMNFDHMPELHFRYGYLACWIVMVAVTLGMIGWFKYKGWFRS